MPGPSWAASSGRPSDERHCDHQRPNREARESVGARPGQQHQGAVASRRERRRGGRPVAVLARGADQPEQQDHHGQTGDRLPLVGRRVQVARELGHDHGVDERQRHAGQRVAEQRARRHSLDQLASDQRGHAATSPVFGQAEEHVLERAGARHQLVQHNALAVCELTHPGGVQPLDQEPTDAALQRGPPAGAAHSQREPLARGGADEHAAVAAALELRDRALAHQPAPVDHDDVIDGLCDLAQHVTRHQHGPAARRALTQQDAQPADALRVQPVQRLVQHQDLRIAEQRRRQPEPLAHPGRIAPDPTVRGLARARRSRAPCRRARARAEPAPRASAGDRVPSGPDGHRTTRCRHQAAGRPAPSSRSARR